MIILKAGFLLLFFIDFSYLNSNMIILKVKYQDLELKLDDRFKFQYDNT